MHVPSGANSAEAAHDAGPPVQASDRCPSAPPKPYCASVTVPKLHAAHRVGNGTESGGQAASTAGPALRDAELACPSTAPEAARSTVQEAAVGGSGAETRCSGSVLQMSSRRAGKSVCSR